ncbi:MAG: hypothetical protein ABIK07_13110 [Planctomycetota bacterium]
MCQNRRSLETPLAGVLSGAVADAVCTSPECLSTGDLELLSDAPRSGSPGRFSPDQIVGLIAIACELVDSISASHVNRILRDVNLKPHRSQYWCNTTEKDPVLFQQQVETVCQTYLDAPELYFQDDTHTVCVDEMTSLQANQRRAKTKPPRPGQTGKG